MIEQNYDIIWAEMVLVQEDIYRDKNDEYWFKGSVGEPNGPFKLLTRCLEAMRNYVQSYLD